MSAFSLFGWEFKRKTELAEEPPSFSPREHDDGAVQVAATGAFGTYIDLDGTVRTEAELITRYRDMALHPEVDAAIDEIVNESISTEELDIIKMRLDKLDKILPPVVLQALDGCFEDVTKLLDFQNHAYDIFRRWYIDGRLYFHVIIDETDTSNGIQEIRYIDPRKIRKIREVVKKRVKGGDITSGEAVVTQTKNEYFVYNDKGFNIGSRILGPTTSGLKIAKDAIIYVTSGVTDTAGAMVLSHLHKAIKPLNQLRTLEDAVVIYRLARAPERRLWYIDVGNLPKAKAEQYVRDIMVKHKNRVNYDAQTGQIRDDRKFMTMLEDYWLPRREGGRGTEVTTLPAGQNLGEMDDVLYFQKKLFASMHVPISRLDPSDSYNLGIATEITRDEMKFGKFIMRMRNRFAHLFIRMMEKQVVLKQIMTIEDFQKVVPYLLFDFARDNYFTEQKNQMLNTGRMTVLGLMMPFVGRYYSNTWIRKNILMQSDEDMMEMDQEIVEELNNPIYNQMPMGEQDPNAEEDPNAEQDGGAVIVDPNAMPDTPANPSKDAGADKGAPGKKKVSPKKPSPKQ